ncbi:MAG: hypothetical protein AB8F74_03400 [Saprospiraceae bacterium]
MIVLRPVGGLCNRILAIASAINLSKDAGRPLKIIWERDPMLNCKFEDLFLPLQLDVELIETKTKQRLFERVLRKATHLQFSKVIYMSTLATNNISVTDIERYNKVLIYGANRFYTLGNLNTTFVVKKEIQNLIPLQVQHKKEKVIGLHIRRTDQKRSILKSPTQLFVDRINLHLNLTPDIVFFLATDSPEEEALLIRTFPTNLIYYNKNSLDRNSKEGIVDALVDLICLSKCSKIYGSYYSSFSFTAAEFGNVKLDVLEKTKAT